MNDEIKRLWDLFEALLAPNRVLNDMLDTFHSERRATYLNLWERLMDMETDVLKLKCELARQQASKDEDAQNDMEGYQE